MNCRAKKRFRFREPSRPTWHLSAKADWSIRTEFIPGSFIPGKCERTPAMNRAMRRQFFFVCLFLLVVTAYVSVFRQGVVSGDSMEPTYHNGQALLVLRRHSFSPLPQRGDVVVLKKDRDTIIKRVAYLPGDIITNQAVIEKTFSNNLADYYEQQPAPEARLAPVLIVPAGYIVVLGDNREISYDSRSFGPVALKDVLGSVVAAPSGPPDIAAP